RERERDILRLVRNEVAAQETEKDAFHLQQAQIVEARREVLAVHVADAVEDYIVRLISATRGDPEINHLSRWIAYGASPRGTIALDVCARAHAWLEARDYVSPADVQAVVHDVLRHRVLLSYEAEADAVNTDKVIDTLLNHVAVP
ncbi:MAG: AAA family ATPase, partial [Gammaproteobacteria bacterium]|nr:AAA family ATPase [Gammaproteobacteria bacterium]